MRKYRKLVHVFSWELSNGPVPKGAYILHTCDNTLCVNPKHLYAGTHRDNMRDMGSRGRQWLQRDSSARRGECNPRSKLTRKQVGEIRAAPKTWGYTTRLARQYGITPGYVCEIKQDRVWKEA